MRRCTGKTDSNGYEKTKSRLAGIR